MDDKKIIGFLTLKDVPSELGTIPAFTKGATGRILTKFEAREEYFSNAYLLANPDFFLPIPEGFKVCEDCGGKSKKDEDIIIATSLGCKTCHGKHLVPVEDKAKCPTCGGVMGLLKVEATFDEGVRRTETSVCWDCYSKPDEKEGE